METITQNQAKHKIFVGPMRFGNSMMKTEWYHSKSAWSKQALKWL